MNFQPLRDFLDYYLPMIGVPGSDTVIYMDHEEIFGHTAGFNSLSLRTPMRKDLMLGVKKISFECGLSSNPSARATTVIVTPSG